MFTNILLPIDGSPLSESAARRGLELAKSLGARVTGLHVREPFQVIGFEGMVPADGLTPEDYEKESLERAAVYLGVIERAAAEAGVICTTQQVESDRPWDAIVKVAEERGCDLIVMGSHGRSGLARWLLGSEVDKVLTHTSIPVLVFH